MPAPSKFVTSAFGAMAFKDLGVSVSLWMDKTWRAINLATDHVIFFEVEQQSELPRMAYNARCLAEARKRGKPVLGQHSGFHDLFVPVRAGSDIALVAGPFALARPKSLDIVERWRAIAHQRANLADPSFSRYLSTTLGTLTLEGPMLALFERLLVCFSRMLGDFANANALAAEFDSLIARLRPTRSAERQWEAARSMVHERTAQVWSTAISRDPLRSLGLKRAPEHVVVGLLRTRSPGQDAIEELLAAHAFQRDTARFATEHGDIVCGQVGDHGVSLLAGFSGSNARVRAELLDVLSAVSTRARRFGFRLHAGVALASGSQRFPARYGAALTAANTALARGVSSAFAPDHPGSTARRLAELRAELAESIDGRKNVLGARFERYVEAVEAHAGYQFDATRAHLEAGLDRLAEPLLSSGQLDRKGFDELCTSLANDPEGALSITKLINGYRGVVSEIERSIQTPTTARQVRSTRRALLYMRERLAEPLTLAEVSRIAGFAPDYFSKLLKRQEGLTFELCLLRMRLERAKHMLASTPHRVSRIANLTGFKSRTHFQQAFKNRTSLTPLEYRRRTAPRE
jgi:AraC-like DNA-binding protein